MAKKVTPASLGVSTAQLWDTTAVNESFKTILANKRQDDQAAAERERQDQLLADKKHDAQQKWIRDELMGYDPDMSNIWESRDGNHLRELANEGFADLLADPGMGEKLYNNDPAAITKLKQFKANIAGRIQKSAEDKVKAAPYIDLMDKYTNAKKAGEVYEDPNYYGNDLDDMSAAFFTPGADIYAPIEKADAMGSWNDYVKEQNAAFKNRDQSVSDHTNPTTGRSYKRSGGKRSEDEISDMIDYHWQQAPNARWMYDQLGIDFNKFNKGDALSPEEEKAIDDFTSDRKREASLDTTESISRGVIKQQEAEITPEDNQYIMDLLATTEEENYEVKEGRRPASDLGFDLKEVDEDKNPIYGEYSEYVPLSMSTPGSVKYGFNDLESILEDNVNVSKALAAESPSGRKGILILGTKDTGDRFIGFDEREALASLITQSNTYKNRKKFANVGLNSSQAPVKDTSKYSTKK